MVVGPIHGDPETRAPRNNTPGHIMRPAETATLRLNIHHRIRPDGNPSFDSYISVSKLHTPPRVEGCFVEFLERFLVGSRTGTALLRWM